MIRHNGRWLLFLATVAVALLPQWGRAACNITESDVDGNGTPDLTLSGDAYHQIVVVELRNSGYLAQIDCNGNGVFTDTVDKTLSGTAEIESFVFDLFGSDDVTINQTEDIDGKMKYLFLNLRALGTRISFNTQGFGILNRTSLAFEITGSASPDTVTLNFGGSNVQDSLIRVRALLAGGNNVMRTTGAATTTNSLIDIDVNIGDAFTLASYNDAGGTYSGSTVEYRVTGGETAVAGDTVADYYGGHYQNSSRVHTKVAALGGADKYRGVFDPSALAIDAGSEVRVWARGGEGFDVLRVFTDPAKTGAPTVNGLLAVDLDGGAQPDLADINWLGLTGTGQFFLRVNQYSSLDKVAASIWTDGSSQNDLWFYLSGGPIKGLGGLRGDIMVAVLNDPGGNATYGPLGAVIVDSGLEQTDTCYVSGNMPYMVLNCEKGTW